MQREGIISIFFFFVFLLRNVFCVAPQAVFKQKAEVTQTITLVKSLRMALSNCCTVESK